MLWIGSLRLCQYPVPCQISMDYFWWIDHLCAYCQMEIFYFPITPSTCISWLSIVRKNFSPSFYLYRQDFRDSYFIINFYHCLFSCSSCPAGAPSRTKCLLWPFWHASMFHWSFPYFLAQWESLGSSSPLVFSRPQPWNQPFIWLVFIHFGGGW